MIKHLLASVLVSAVSLSAAMAETVSLSTPSSEIDITRHNTNVVIDESATLEIRDVIRLVESDWDSQPESLVFGYGDAAIWMDVSLGTPTDPPPVLMDLYGLDRFDVWILPPDGGSPVFQGRSGWVSPPGTDQGGFVKGLSAVVLEGWTQPDSRLLIRTASTTSRNLRYRLVGPNRFATLSFRLVLLQGAGVGVMALMLVIVLFLLQFSLNARHISFFLLVVLNLVLVIYLIGLGPLSLWHGNPVVTDSINRTVYLLLGIVNLWFFSTFLDPAKHRNLYYFIRVPMLILAATLLVNPMLPGPAGYLVNIIVLSALYIYVAFFLLYIIRKKVPMSWRLAFGWFLVLLAGILTNLMYSGAVSPPGWMLNISSPLVVSLVIQSAVFVVTILVSAEKRFHRERRKRSSIEKELIRSRRDLADSDRMNGLARSVSVFTHELSNPIGNIRLLSTELKSRVFETQQQVDNLESLPTVVSDFLEFSGDSYSLIDSTLLRAWEMIDSFKVVASDEARVPIRTISVDEYLSHLCRVLLPSVRKKGHKIETDLQDAGKLRTVPGFLSQIVTNLVNNAMNHALPDGRTVSIILSSRRVSDEEIEISVSDNGAGIPEANESRIFESYFTTSGDSGGTGLGLAISRDLAMNHLDGTLEYEPGENGGSVFRLRVKDLPESTPVQGEAADRS